MTGRYPHIFGPGSLSRRFVTGRATSITGLPHRPLAGSLTFSHRERRLPIDDWAKLLGDVVVVAPLLDRRMHHGHLLEFEGKNWRLKEAAERVA